MPPDNTEEIVNQPETPTVPVLPAIEKTGNAIWGNQEQPKRKKNDLSDMFAVPQQEDNDMDTSDLFDIPEEDVEMDDNLNDIMQVSNEDVMGRPPKPRQPRYRRTVKPYVPPTSMGGTR